MKIEIILESDRKDLQINLLCPTVNQEVNELYAYLTAYEQNVGGWLNERHQRVHINEILYFESVDGKTFFYTNALTCQTKKKLYDWRLYIMMPGSSASAKLQFYHCQRLVKSFRKWAGGLSFV